MEVNREIRRARETRGESAELDWWEELGRKGFLFPSLALLSLLARAPDFPPPTQAKSNVPPFQPYIPPPDYKLPPEKRGYLRHVAVEPKHVQRENFQVESVHLKHRTQKPINKTQSQPLQYSHLLRKTGRRGELGIEDEDDSDVTRISFNVPLVGVSWRRYTPASIIYLFFFFYLYINAHFNMAVIF